MEESTTEIRSVISFILFPGGSSLLSDCSLALTDLISLMVRCASVSSAPTDWTKLNWAVKCSVSYIRSGIAQNLECLFHAFSCCRQSDPVNTRYGPGAFQVVTPQNHSVEFFGIGYRIFQTNRLAPAFRSVSGPFTGFCGEAPGLLKTVENTLTVSPSFSRIASVTVSFFRRFFREREMNQRTIGVISPASFEPFEALPLIL
jgi:hypothetical protein